MAFQKKWNIREGLLIERVESIIHTPGFLATVTQQNVMELMPYFSYLSIARNADNTAKIAGNSDRIVAVQTNYDEATLAQIVADIEGLNSREVTAQQLSTLLNSRTVALYNAHNQLSGIVNTISTKVNSNETIMASELQEAQNIFDAININFQKIKDTFGLLCEQGIIEEI